MKAAPLPVASKPAKHTQDLDPIQVFKAAWWALCSHHTLQVEGQTVNHSLYQQSQNGLSWKDIKDHLVPIPFHM